MGSITSPLAKVGILSIGDMGVGIARLLIDNQFKVLTNASDRRYMINVTVIKLKSR